MGRKQGIIGIEVGLIRSLHIDQWQTQILQLVQLVPVPAVHVKLQWLFLDYALLSPGLARKVKVKLSCHLWCQSCHIKLCLLMMLT